MSRPTAALSARRIDDRGMTLVELLVAITISVVLGGIVLSMLLAAQTSTKSTTTADDINAEARAALNRISRDLRQAVPTYLSSVETPGVVAVQNPDGTGHVSGAVTSLTMQADFNGDGCVAGRASDPLAGSASGTSCNPAKSVDPSNPEIETFCWDGNGASGGHIYLIAGTVNAGSCTPTSGASEPLVSGKITSFTLDFTSSLYRYDANGDGTTTWDELDSAGAPAGNDDGVLDTPELDNISGVTVSLTASNGSQKQSYQTQVDLRNMS